MDQCVKGGVYRIHSRNLSLGVYDGNQGFIGIRYKFGDRYLFTEYHWDQGPPYGTVHPIEKIGDLPPEIPCEEVLGSFATHPVTGQEEEVKRHDLKEGEAPHGERHGFADEWAKDGTRLPDKLYPYLKTNKQLFDFLSEFAKNRQD
jgi:hypothetical protein